MIVKLVRFIFFYAHLSAIHSGLERGDHVRCGELLGETGCTGNANGMTSIALGAHLHFEVRVKETWSWYSKQA
ncbi:M23 family metallopeptidase [Klebsiella pneumoniae]